MDANLSEVMSLTMSECLIIIAVCLLPWVLAAGVYWSTGRRALPLPTTFIAVVAYVFGGLDLLMLTGVLALSLLTLFLPQPVVLLSAAMTIGGAGLQVAVTVLLMKSPSRLRLLFTWSLGGLLGMFLYLVLLALGVVVALKGHGGPVVLLLVAALLPLLVSGGRLLTVPLARRWQRQVRERAAIAASLSDNRP